jgi:UTP--glucose-1-phosphate uridylyltransferase
MAVSTLNVDPDRETRPLEPNQGAVAIDASRFIEKTHQDAQRALAKELTDLVSKTPEEQRPLFRRQMDAFSRLFTRYLNTGVQSLDWSKIKPPPKGAMKSLGELPAPDEKKVSALLSKLAVLKLNGGLGTTMGCSGPKSIIPVRAGLSFLDLTVQQIENLNKRYNADVPLVLMNSFNTDNETERLRPKYSGFRVRILAFQQSNYPRLKKDSLLPMALTPNINAKQEAWYPPGHGDLYESLAGSGILQKLLSEGREILFVSNVDNLGATVDLTILNFLANGLPDVPAPEFLMELTEKTRADVKGGTLIEYENKLRLLEMAQVPKEHVDEFASVRKFRIFNTNNLWTNLRAVERVMAQGTLQMEVIVNPKTLDDGTGVIQLETAVGAAVQSFNHALGLDVPRARFLPVKTCSDMLLLMSDLYELDAVQGTLGMSSKRSFPSVPLVKLGSHFRKVKDFLNRFEAIPNLLELDHLTVSGDVTFGKGVALKGTVIIIAGDGERINIPAGAQLENKIVSGNLRILDH